MRPRLVHLLFGATVAGICIAGAASEKSDQAGDVSIESAKREFDTLREASGISSESRLRMPKISGPQIPVTADPSDAMVPTRKASLEEKRKKEREKNWLLDAMLEQPEDATEADSLKKEQEALRADPFEQMIAEQLSPTKEREEEETEIADAGRTEDLAVNPLSAFMSDWVSDQDRELLLPDAEKRKSEEGWLTDSVAPSPIASVSRSTPYSNILPEVGAFDQVENAVGANPYLDFQTPVFKEPVRHAPTQIVPQYDGEPTDRSVGEPIQPLRPSTTVSPPINRDDEAKKYFPQLKRF